jgi:hypothetical protein
VATPSVLVLSTTFPLLISVIIGWYKYTAISVLFNVPANW